MTAVLLMYSSLEDPTLFTNLTLWVYMSLSLMIDIVLLNELSQG